jgi:hypothetical protein
MEFNKGDIVIYKFQHFKEEEGEIYGLSDSSYTDCYQVFFKLRKECNIQNILKDYLRLKQSNIDKIFTHDKIPNYTFHILF